VSCLITLGVPAYDDWKVLERLLKTLLDQRTDAPYEIIVADDHHPDDLAARVNARFPQIKTLRNEQNRGPAYGRNRIIEMARGEYIAFFDADCVVPPDWIEKVRPHLTPQTIISGRVVRPDGSVEWGPRKATWLGVSLPCKIPEANVASSNNMVVPASLAKAVGGFNEGLGIYFEDSLFSLQCRRMGARVVYLESAQVEHHHHSLLNPRRLQLQSRNTLWAMYNVHRQRRGIQIAAVACLSGIYLAKAVLHLFKLEQAHATAYLQGIRDGFTQIARGGWKEDWIGGRPPP